MISFRDWEHKSKYNENEEFSLGYTVLRYLGILGYAFGRQSGVQICSKGRELDQKFVVRSY